MNPTRALIIDDDPSVLASSARLLERAGHVCETAPDAATGVAKLEAGTFDVILLDFQLPDATGLEVIERLQASKIRVPVIMLSAVGTTSVAAEAIRRGAVDFIDKPFETDRLLVTVRNVVEMGRLRSHVGDETQQSSAYGLLARSPSLRDVCDTIDKVATTDSRVLILGENGTGKELVARALHEGSLRSEEVFISLNCAAVPSELIESTLFGHVKGAFTGAEANRIGAFELADAGTLFLDEVGDMPLLMQTKLLRALQSGEFQPVGTSETRHASVRVLSATNRDLDAMMQRGEFREDLYYRLNVVPIRLPPLRQRLDDLGLLIDHFVSQATREGKLPERRFGVSAIEAMRGYPFPGNVRELENLVERLLILARGEEISAADIHRHLAIGGAPQTGGKTDLFIPGVSFKDAVDSAQRLILEAALEHHDYNMAATARALDLERSFLYKKCDALGVERSRD